MKKVISIFLVLVTILAFVSIFGIAGYVESGALAFKQGLKEVLILGAVMLASANMAVRLDGDAE